jgi:hypothetical protein
MNNDEILKKYEKKYTTYGSSPIIGRLREIELMDEARADERATFQKEVIRARNIFNEYKKANLDWQKKYKNSKKQERERIKKIVYQLLEEVRAISVFEPDTKAKTYENGFRNGNNSAIDLVKDKVEKLIDDLSQIDNDGEMIDDKKER